VDGNRLEGVDLSLAQEGVEQRRLPSQLQTPTLSPECPQSEEQLWRRHRRHEPDALPVVDPPHVSLGLPATAPPSPPPMLSDLLPLLLCSQCSPPSLLVAPVTLLCGHTFCARHFAHSTDPPLPHSAMTSSFQPPNAFPAASSPPTDIPPRPSRFLHCPLSDCPTTPTQNPSAYMPNIPSSSTVSFYPPPGLHLDIMSDPSAGISESQTDVTLNKVIDLVRRTQQRIQQTGPSSSLGLLSDECTDTDSESEQGSHFTPSPCQCLSIL